MEVNAWGARCNRASGFRGTRTRERSALRRLNLRDARKVREDGKIGAHTRKYICTYVYT